MFLALQARSPSALSSREAQVSGKNDRFYRFIFFIFYFIFYFYCFFLHDKNLKCNNSPERLSVFSIFPAASVLSFRSSG